MCPFFHDSIIIQLSIIALIVEYGVCDLAFEWISFLRQLLWLRSSFLQISICKTIINCCSDDLYRSVRVIVRNQESIVSALKIELLHGLNLSPRLSL